MEENKIVFRHDKPESLSKFERETRIIFLDKKLLKLAFTHRSFQHEDRSKISENNERLEFLGDAVVQLIVTKHLFKLYPKSQEGDLTNYRSSLVNTAMFSSIGYELGMHEYLLLSKEQRADMKTARHIIADTFEAFVGAVYLDQGFSVAETFVSGCIFPRIHGIVERNLWRDWKSVLQAKAQEYYKITPHYEVISESGSPQDKLFVLEAKIGDLFKAEGSGKSKTEAGKDAARKLCMMKGWA